MFFKRNRGDKFYDRGDPAAADFAHTDLTIDNDWHSLDLSSIIPAGVSLVLLRVVLNCSDGWRNVLFRTHGNSNTINTSYIRNFSAGSEIPFDVYVTPDSDGVIDYKVTPDTWSKLTIAVAGWFRR